jgi:hypothetical protein
LYSHYIQLYDFLYFLVENAGWIQIRESARANPQKKTSEEYDRAPSRGVTAAWSLRSPAGLAGLIKQPRRTA